MSVAGEQIIKRFKQAVSRKTNWDEVYRDALEYSAPHRESFDDTVPGLEKQGKGKVFDSTAVSAMNKFAANLQSSLVPPMQKWIDLAAGASVEDPKNFSEQLEEVTKVFFATVHASNFDTQIAESFLDLAVGTGALLVQKGADIRNPLMFTSIPLSELYLEEGAFGSITTAFRKTKIQVRNITTQWEDAKLTKELKEKLEEKPDEDVIVVEGTFPAKVKLLNKTTKKVEEIDGFKYVVVEEATKEILVERDQRSSPWVIFRYSVMPGEIYGRGPLLSAMPDVRTINKTKELLLKKASIDIFGMYTAEDDGVINIQNIKFGPGAIIPVGSNGGPRGATLMPLQSSGNINLAQLVIEDLRKSINDIMLVDPMGPIDLPVKSATEISLRQQELVKRIGSAFGRLQYELLSPLVNRVLDLLDEQGLIDIGGLRVDGNIIAIEHISPLASAQGEEDFTAMRRYAEFLTQTFGPQMAMALMKPDKMSQEAARKLKVPEKLIPSDEEFEEIKKQAAAAAQSGEIDPSKIAG